MTTYVLGFCFNLDHSKVVLIRKTRPEWQAGRLNGIGGHVEPGESPADAMAREFREEAAWPAIVGWVEFGRLRGDGWEVHLFLGTYDLVPGPYRDGPEGEASVHHVASVLAGTSKDARTLPNLRWIVPMALNHATGEDSAAYFDIREAQQPAPRVVESESCICPGECDCALPDTSPALISNGCPVHNDLPEVVRECRATQHRNGAVRRS